MNGNTCKAEDRVAAARQVVLPVRDWRRIAIHLTIGHEAVVNEDRFETAVELAC